MLRALRRRRRPARDPRDLPAGPAPRTPELPLVLFGYANPIFVRGPAAFAARRRRGRRRRRPVRRLAARRGLRAHFELARRKLDFIPLLAPTSTPSASAPSPPSASGFVYYVSLTGITGRQAGRPRGPRRHVAEIRALTGGRLPIAVGFGIATPERGCARWPPSPTAWWWAPPRSRSSRQRRRRAAIRCPSSRPSCEPQRSVARARVAQGPGPGAHVLDERAAQGQAQPVEHPALEQGQLVGQRRAVHPHVEGLAADRLWPGPQGQRLAHGLLPGQRHPLLERPIVAAEAGHHLGQQEAAVWGSRLAGRRLRTDSLRHAATRSGPGARRQAASFAPSARISRPAAPSARSCYLGDSTRIANSAYKPAHAFAFHRPPRAPAEGWVAGCSWSSGWNG